LVLWIIESSALNESDPFFSDFEKLLGAGSIDIDCTLPTGFIPKRLEVTGITQAVIPEVFYRESSGMTGFLLRACRNDET